MINCPLLGNGSINAIAETNTHAVIEELLKVVFPMRSDMRLNKEDQRDKRVSCYELLAAARQTPSKEDGEYAS